MVTHKWSELTDLNTYKVSPLFRLLPDDDAADEWNGNQPSQCFSEYQAKLCEATIGEEELVSLTVLLS